jgi:hypothetical protein
MKTRFLLFAIAACLVIVFYRCDEGEDDANQLPTTADYSTNITVFISWPDNYQFDVTGTTHVDINGNTFGSTSDMTIGQSIINDVEINGTLQGNEITFTDEQFLVHIPVPGGDTLEEEVTLSMGPVDFTKSNIAGNEGRVILRMTDDTVTERGTFTYSLVR